MDRLPPAARHVLPQFTERTAHGFRTLDPYEKLLSERIILLGTPIDETAASDVIAQLMHLEHAAPDRHISLYINSPGGSFSAMCAVYDTMRYIGCEMETVCVGQAASAAAVLLAAGTPGRRMVLPHARVLLHQPAIAEPVRGQPSDLEIQARELARAHDGLVEMLALHTGREPGRVRQDIERDLFLDPAGALAYGLVDAVVPHRGKQSAPVAGR
ncbi:ATP-dependent Clp protease proteolytic subunit [Streptomyces sp. NPDC049577]|uniref:ATP-dependent Clp protease proteolytic subunit n=1 Tax=Streptomyces sp. NPDC049577 TaxID=3155153 RepID=UPI003424950F